MKSRTKKLGSVDKYNAAKLPFMYLPESVKSELRATCPCRIQAYFFSAKKWVALRPTPNDYVFDQSAAYRIKPDPVVTIDVRGGVASLRGNPRGVTVRIIDHDNQGG